MKDLMTMGIKRDALLAELAPHWPQWNEETTVLLRVVAARVSKNAGVPRKLALAESAAVNHAIKVGITLGYALRDYDRARGINREIKPEVN